MKRIIGIMLLTLLTTGCSIEYNLKIDKDTASEEVVTILENNQENKNLINNLDKNGREAYYDEDSNESKYYSITKEKNKNSNQLKLLYRYNYPIEKLKYSNAISECFYNKSIVKDQKYITLSTSKGVNCIYRDVEKQIDKLVVNIETHYELVETNADVIKDNKYTWNITEENYQNKSIYLKIDYTKEKINKNVINEKIIGIFLFVFIILSLIIIFFFKMRGTKKYE